MDSKAGLLRGCATFPNALEMPACAPTRQGATTSAAGRKRSRSMHSQPAPIAKRKSATATTGGIVACGTAMCSDAFITQHIQQICSASADVVMRHVCGALLVAMLVVW